MHRLLWVVSIISRLIDGFCLGRDGLVTRQNRKTGVFTFEANYLRGFQMILKQREGSSQHNVSVLPSVHRDDRPGVHRALVDLTIGYIYSVLRIENNFSPTCP